MINIFQPALGTEELEAVRRVFDSNWVGKGKITDRFESDFASFIGADRSLVRSLSCCTEGLFQSMNLLGIGAGDEVVLPSIHFVGAGNAVVESGATPVFCDVDAATLNTTAELVERALTPRTKAVCIIHYGGVPCDMDPLSELVAERELYLIEDSACSVASKYKGKACGTFGDVAVWSFDSMKILVSVDGSMIYCRSEELAQRAEELLYLGLVGKSGFSSQSSERWWEFDVSLAGRRAIMNDVLSAIGVEQLKKLPDFIARRRSVSDFYDEALSGFDWLRLPPVIPSDVDSSYYFYHVRTEPQIRDRLARYLRDRGVYTTFRYYPLHLVEFYQSSQKLLNAESAAESVLCLPIHQSLSGDDLATVAQLIRDFGKDV